MMGVSGGCRGGAGGMGGEVGGGGGGKKRGRVDGGWVYVIGFGGLGLCDGA